MITTSDIPSPSPAPHNTQAHLSLGLITLNNERNRLVDGAVGNVGGVATGRAIAVAAADGVAGCADVKDIGLLVDNREVLAAHEGAPLAVGITGKNNVRESVHRVA